MQVTTYLNFNGNCEAAFKFYAQALGGKITMKITQRESPMGDKVPAEMKNKILRATLEMPGGGVLIGRTTHRARRCSLRVIAYQSR